MYTNSLKKEEILERYGLSNCFIYNVENRAVLNKKVKCFVEKTQRGAEAFSADLLISKKKAIHWGCVSWTSLCRKKSQ